MRAVFRHELSSYFTGVTGYVFSAFLLLFTGIYTMVYNLQSASVHFEYVLGSMSFVFLIIVPILTMRVLAEERRQKTDQLLYSLPLTMTQVVLGKFAAMLVVFAVPMAVICLYPVVLSAYGNVYLPAAYGAIVGFFFLGMALLAIGMYISSVTESQAVAAGLCFVVMLVNYFLSDLAGFASSTAYSSLAALAVTALGGAVAYFVSGKALKPLKRFTAKAERVQLQSLTEITLSEDEAVEFSRLSRAINQMLLRLNQAFDAQQQFVGNAAHELRTPLALMQARLDLYMATDHGDNRPETAETISMLREQTERLSKMVRTLLDMSDLKAVPRTDKIQLAPMIEEVLADLSPLAEKNGVALSQAGEDLWITGSDVLVYRSIFNLVENGVKYNHPGGSVRISASRRGSSAVIEVRDTGCGIPENFGESVFQPFFRVDKSRSREKGGVGLGLSLVWEIAHLHGGSVRITESGKDGTVIELTLPISAEE